jgi:hypothetical protein
LIGDENTFICRIAASWREETKNFASFMDRDLGANGPYVLRGSGRGLQFDFCGVEQVSLVTSTATEIGSANSIT